MKNEDQVTTNQLIDVFQETILQYVPLEQETLFEIRPFLQKKEFPRRSFLLRAGDHWDKLYFIHRGLIRLFYLDLEGREFNKAFFSAENCIWPVAPHDRNQAILFNIAAIENTIILACPFQKIYDILQQTGNWERFALPFAEKLVEQKFQREHDFLLLSAKERFEKFTLANPDMARRIPDYHMASFLGITNVSLSRIKRASNF